MNSHAFHSKGEKNKSVADELSKKGAEPSSPGFSDNRPEAIAQRRLNAVIGSSVNAGGVIQRSANGFGGAIIQMVDQATWGGTFSTEKYKPVVERYDGKSIGADIRIVFTPNPRCPKNVTIGLVQIVRMTGADQASSPLQEKLLNQGGPWAIDRAEDANPVYGSNDDRERSGQLTDNPPDPREGNQFGSTAGKGGQPATLEDTPVLPMRANTKQGQYFEVTAMVLDGPKTGLCLGTVSWGWTKEANAEVATCEDFTLVRDSGASENFEQAKEAWNALSEEERLVQLPDLSGAPQNEEGNGCCYLTTACTEYKGLPDDCEELTVLRKFRDTYLREKANGEELLHLYYDYSPMIVAAIRRREDEEEILERLYGIIRECVDAINKRDPELAFKTYCKTVIDLKNEFIPECKMPHYCVDL